MPQLIWQAYLVVCRLLNAACAPSRDPFAICFALLLLKEVLANVWVSRVYRMVKNDERNIIPFLPIQLGGMGSALFLVAVKDEATSERHSRVMMIAMAWGALNVNFSGRLQQQYAGPRFAAAVNWIATAVFFTALLVMDQFYSPVPALSRLYARACVILCTLMTITSGTVSKRPEEGFPGRCWRRTLISWDARQTYVPTNGPDNNS
ncbi:hypothetical protein NQ176_g1291 [Zarea fungicola]|uniref:Uncharacterized protein n=1 Tax=Zarea fungicola TaxID=93591 RepID=A0ACC1NW93_9HYPO|nr:hypothetical protein NQ176_g1291 [Lecanicillium fungicola]